MFLGGCERWMLRFWMLWNLDVMILDALILIPPHLFGRRLRRHLRERRSTLVPV